MISALRLAVLLPVTALLSVDGEAPEVAVVLPGAGAENVDDVDVDDDGAFSFASRLASD
jgi:hypothetical protein